MTELVLGIETSCDDTAVALVDRQGNVVSAVMASQIDIHEKFGGVYPEFAGRAHINSILPVVHKVFEQGGVKPRDIRAIGVTRGPGLIGSLLVGLNTAASLGMGWNKPVIGVNHLRGHLRSADLEQQRVQFPAVILLVSGGHTLLAYSRSVSDISLLGSTLDDSVGEAYDKVGRMLGLGFPGGPAVDKLAKTGSPSLPFPKPLIKTGLDFSFSGLKSAVSRYMESGDEVVHADVAASFVDVVMDILITKSRRAIQSVPCKSFVVVGGVAASPQLRAAAENLCQELHVELCLPPIKWSTDNGAMIALATWDYLDSGRMIEPVPQVQLYMGDY